MKVMAKVDIITTNADKLLAVLREKKVISVKEAAKQLDTSMADIEKLASVMGEEDMVDIDYRFFQPYILLKEKKSAYGEKETEIKEKQKRSFFKKAKETTAEIRPKKQSRLVIAIKNFQLNNLIKGAERSIKSGNVKKARNYYDKIVRLYQSVPENSFKPKLMLLNEKLESKEQEVWQKKAEENISKIKALIAKAKNELSMQDYTSSLATFYRMHSLYHELPLEFVTSKEYAEIISINKSVLKNLDKITIEKLPKDILKNLDLASLKEKASQLEVKEIDTEIKKGISKLKVIAKKIKTYHPKKRKKKAEILKNEVNLLKAKIMLLKAKELISENDAQSANEYYLRLNTLLSEIPESALRQQIFRQVTELGKQLNQ